MPETCRQCGMTLSTEADRGRRCPNPDCPTNKKTRPICRRCEVVMEYGGADGGTEIYRCPKCGVTARA